MIMTHKEVITALRSTPSRSKRELFDTAADMIEQMMDKPVVSNADRIRAMSDEELAEFLCGVYDDDTCGVYGAESGKFINGITIMDYDEFKIVEWLRQPADPYLFREATKKEVASDVLMRPDGEEDLQWLSISRENRCLQTL